MHSEIIEGMLHLISSPRGKNLENTAIKAYTMELQMLLTLHALQPTLFFKHEAYANEMEYRFLQIHKATEPPTVKLRARPYSLVRYREFDWRGVEGALKQIVIGPSADRNKAVQFAEDCLSQFYSGAVQVKGSEIPYRTV